MRANRWSFADLAVLGLAIFAIVVWTFNTVSTPPTYRVATKSKDGSITPLDFNLPIAFEPNRGQSADPVKFLSRAKGFRLFIANDETVIALNAVETPHTKNQRPSHVAIEQPRVIRIKLVGASHAQKIDARDRLPGKVNYLIGADPAHWHLDVPLYRIVTQHDVWPGIDLAYYGDSERQLESDFVIAPNADPRSIRLAIESGDNLNVDHDGNLQIAVGRRTVTLLKPRTYQRVDGRDRPIDGRYVLDSTDGARQVRFEVASYDRSQALVIDPKVVLNYSTYLGGTDFDEGHGIGVDDARSAYVTGRTRSADFPSIDHLIGNEDAFVTKFTPDGKSLVYSTLIGGTGGKGITEAFAIHVSSGGHAYITGATDTTNFPTTAHAFQANAPGAGGHTFVSELTPNGQSFVFSTYVASSDHSPCDANEPNVDWGTGIDVELSTPTVWVTGITCSAHFPARFPFQSSSDVSYPAGFLFAYNPGGFGFKRGLQFSTYIGGLRGFTFSNAVSLNHHRLSEKLAVWVAGFTQAADFPTKNAFDAHLHGQTNSFLMKFRFKPNDPFASLAYSTFLGGNQFDEALGLAVDGNGHAYVVGNFASSNFPFTNSLNVGGFRVYPASFVTKFSQDGKQLLYSDWIGDVGNQINAIAVFNGSAYITGFADFDSRFPTVNAFQDTPRGNDAFVAKISQDGASLLYSTRLGGAGNDVGKGIAVGPGGDAFVTGVTESSDFPLQNAYDTANPAGRSAFVTKLHLSQATEAPTHTPTRTATRTPTATPTPLAAPGEPGRK